MLPCRWSGYCKKFRHQFAKDPNIDLSKVRAASLTSDVEAAIICPVSLPLWSGNTREWDGKPKHQATNITMLTWKSRRTSSFQQCEKLSTWGVGIPMCHGGDCTDASGLGVQEYWRTNTSYTCSNNVFACVLQQHSQPHIQQCCFVRVCNLANCLHLLMIGADAAQLHAGFYAAGHSGRYRLYEP